MSESLATPADLVRTTVPNVSWQTAMKVAIRSAGELCSILSLPASFTRAVTDAEQDNGFSVFVPREFLRRMQPGDPHDPLLRQVLPDPAESAEVPGFDPDPVGEFGKIGEDSDGTGVLRKYAGRALMMAHQACGVHCRYCFRRHFPYDAVASGSGAWDGAIAALDADSSIEEVILSGGDPLVMTDISLRQLIQRLAAVPHLRRLRIHSRMPIVIPQRITEGLILAIRGTRLVPWIVVHANHPAELDDAILRSLALLVDAGIPVLNQAVLLAGVNDEPEIMEALCRTLIDARIHPYYLHQLDRVAGAAHFEVPVERGMEIMEHLRQRLPGYAVPRYVREVAGEPSKSPVELVAMGLAEPIV